MFQAKPAWSTWLAMHRLFVALRPPAIIRDRLLAAMDGIAGARWQEDEQLHITVRYIGLVERAMAEDIAVALDGVRASPITVAIAGVGAFEDRARRAVWAGVAPREPLTALHRKVDHVLIRLGLAPEGRTYLPHVTIARLNRAAGPAERYLADQAMLSSAPFTLDHFLLFESHLGQDGATYHAVARYPLRG
jgi:2'-5' RNA ligase